MVLCFVALFVFAVLGIFSAKYRKLAGEALDCVVRAVTLRPCESRLDERLQATIVGSVLTVNPSAARTIHRNFKAISLAFTVLFFISFAYSAIAVYNYWAFGNCNGPDSTAFCVFDAVLGKNPQPLTPVLPGVGPRLGNGNTTLVEFGCFTCPYTRQSQSALFSFLSKHPEVSLEFRAFPIPTHPNSTLSAQAALCAGRQGAFWPYASELFNSTEKDRDVFLNLSLGLNLNTSAFATCLDQNQTLSDVERDVAAGKSAGIYGTPTFFIGNVSLVGPQTEAQFESALAGKGSDLPTGGSCPPPEGINPTEPI